VTKFVTNWSKSSKDDNLIECTDAHSGYIKSHAPRDTRSRQCRLEDVMAVTHNHARTCFPMIVISMLTNSLSVRQTHN